MQVTEGVRQLLFLWLTAPGCELCSLTEWAPLLGDGVGLAAIGIRAYINLPQGEENLLLSPLQSRRPKAPTARSWVAH